MGRLYTCQRCGSEQEKNRTGRTPKWCPRCRDVVKTGSPPSQPRLELVTPDRREAHAAALTMRHQAVVHILQASLELDDVDHEQLHIALLDELTGPLEWHGVEQARATFRAALGRR